MTDLVRAEPCTCFGDCRNGFDPIACANWHARTASMVYQPCKDSGDMTWHRDGVCAGCHPMFPNEYSYEGHS